MYNSNYPLGTGSSYAANYDLRAPLYRQIHSYAQRQERLNNRVLRNVIVLDDDKDTELRRFLYQEKPCKLHADRAVGLLRAYISAHKDKRLSQGVLEELHIPLLKFLLYDRSPKVWWQMLLDSQNRGGHNDPLEDCLAMGLRITDLEALKSHWKIRIFQEREGYPV
ncbi:MAG: hypothetical protein LQ339_001817 [Xanthoria mediterranea]|nr:MAG: hypothetical protein LQ339_001817 [Xanthoria mediterranea]